MRSPTCQIPFQKLIHIQTPRTISLFIVGWNLVGKEVRDELVAITSLHTLIERRTVRFLWEEPETAFCIFFLSYWSTAVKRLRMLEKKK